MELGKPIFCRSCTPKTMTKFINYMLSRACVLTLILAMVLHAGVAPVNADRVCDYNSRPHERGLCGSRLADTISAACSMFSGRLFSRYIVKRQTDKFLDDNLRGIVLNKKDALSYLAKRETTGNIVCECCYHQCSYLELIQYCDLPGGIPRRSSNNNRAATFTN